MDSRNLYTPKSSRFPGRKASRNVLASRSFTPGSPWALGIVMTPRRKDSGSNLALGITIVEIRLIDWFIKALVTLARMVLIIWLGAINERWKPAIPCGLEYIKYLRLAGDNPLAINFKRAKVE
jgi:hypothetical protein